ncbi:YncE family protein [Mucilaginibacter limnophilus]|uniref:YncE family protein n=1 Tax=Mucilaginibacter limnophilus TaxID=1932778 RepID=A0A3S2V1Q3_9SPHI|nr:YncE family protein [Mucilaginibacter limnophilus]RVU00879.1 YncE family protein [Mucilaginibacter limnophilus]
MKQINTKYLLLGLALTVLLASCSKDKDDPKPTAPEPGVYVLNEGGFGTPNASLTFYGYTSKATTADIFSTKNGRVLGDTGNEIKQYGSKIYIAVDRSGTVEVIDRTGASIKKIELKDGGVTRGPRSFAFNNGKAYVVCYDGHVAVLDTASLSVGTLINVGRNPDQIGIANNKLYVANSGGIPGDENTVSVINLSNLAVKAVTVGDNPFGIAVDSDNQVYVTAYGKWGVSASSLTIIDSSDDHVISKTDFEGGALTISGNKGYFVGYDGKVKVYDTKTEAIVNENFISDNTELTAPYAVAVNEASGDVYITDALTYDVDGDCYIFNKDGKKQDAFKTGINPGSILFINK